MRILLDECLPRALRKGLPGHEVRTVSEMGWGGVKNGALLRLAEGRFEVLTTVDRGMPFENPVERRRIALAVLRAAGIRWDQLAPLVPALLDALPTMGPGEVRRFDA